MKLKTLLVHIACWLVLFLYFLTAWLIESNEHFYIWLDVSMNLARVIQFYFCYLLVYPRFYQYNRGWELVLGIVAAYVLFVVVRTGLEEGIYPKLLNVSNYAPGTPIRVFLIDNLYYGLPFILIAAAVFFTQKALQGKKYNAQLRAEAQKAELAFLHAQINPHFLFNTLNYMYSLALPVSDKLSKAITDLGEMMQYSLQQNEDGKVDLDSEYEYIESYINLFNIRFEPNFFVKLTFEEDGIVRPRIAPLLLIPFVENAFKHGVVNDHEHPITINLTAKGKKVHFSVHNKIHQLQKDASSGIGIVNVQKRLLLLYPGKHVLQIKEENGFYSTELELEV
ncbi:histidine kinase [Chitinophaga skermanii]|uniref:Histidine kinase n=1 Tax=Chitinophaga skermanii TaxID=331697 RepID=A0A327QWV4_9BACT|nr:histidine kinase [Chitinophaga skermanii]RAJ08194.1 histidine kinase [Chitinophaga skermanii]